jgi:hypothetical protein
MKRTLWLSSVLLVGSLVFCAPLVARDDETDRAMPAPGFNLFSMGGGSRE